MKSSQPYVCLLCDGEVEIPSLAIFCLQFWVQFWVAVLSTKPVFVRVFAGKMEDINSQANTFESWISCAPNVLCKFTIVIKENVVWHVTIDLIDLLDKFL